jgi:hypothetical protein
MTAQIVLPKPLTSLQRCQDYIPNFPDAHTPILKRILDSTSAFVCRYCNRDFWPQDYTEYLNGTGFNNLLLSQYPVLAVSRVSTALLQIVQIRNTDFTHSRAIGQLTSTELLLNAWRGATQTSQLTFTLTNYNTLGDLATAINNAGDSWTALAMGQYAAWSPLELPTPQGGFDALWGGACYLKAYTRDLYDFQLNGNTGELVSWQGFFQRYLGYRIQYTAGYQDANGTPAIPELIQQAVVEIAASVYLSRGVNIGLKSESESIYSYTLSDSDLSSLNIPTMYALDLYKNRRVPRYSIV